MGYRRFGHATPLTSYITYLKFFLPIWRKLRILVLQMEHNYKIPVTPDPSREYFNIPNAANYVIRDDAVVYRRLKNNRLRQLKATARSHGERRTHYRVAIRDDNGKQIRIRPFSLLERLTMEREAVRDLPYGYMDLPDVWLRYSVNRNGDVLQMQEDSYGEIYYHHVPYHMDKTNSYTTLERVSLRNQSFQRRTYTRQRLQQMYAERMEELTTTQDT